MSEPTLVRPAPARSTLATSAALRAIFALEQSEPPTDLPGIKAAMRLVLALAKQAAASAPDDIAADFAGFVAYLQASVDVTFAAASIEELDAALDVIDLSRYEPCNRRVEAWWQEHCD